MHVQDYYLGFTFDTKRMMTIKVPEKKLQNLRQRLRQTQQMTAMTPAMQKALLHIRYLQRDLTRRTLRGHYQNWETAFRWSKEARDEITVVVAESYNEERTANQTDPDQSPRSDNIYTDSSETGWGIASKFIMKTHGYWTEEEKQWFINVRELMAIYFALKLHAPNFRDKTIKIFTDNTTSIKYTTKAGGTASLLLQEIAIKIQELCYKFGIEVYYQHVKGILNTEADTLSKKQVPV